MADSKGAKVAVSDISEEANNIQLPFHVNV